MASPLKKLEDKEAGLGTRIFNTALNPLEHENILSPTGSNPERKALYHGAGLVAGVGGMAFLVRTLIQQKERADRHEEAEKIRTYVNARFPTLSLDPNLDDAELEEEIRSQGITPTEGMSELDKSAASNAPISNVFPDVSEYFSKTVDQFSKGEVDTKHLAVALTAALAGGIGGWQLADYMADSQRKKELDTRVLDARNVSDKLLYEEFQRTRGRGPVQKVAADTKSLSEVTSGKNKDVGPIGAIGNAITSPAGTAGVIGSVYWLWVAAAFALSYRASKGYLDDEDPARQRAKQLKAVAREKARVRQAPTFTTSFYPEQEGALKASPAKKSVTSTALPEKATEDLAETAVDKSDPYAAMLQG